MGVSEVGLDHARFLFKWGLERLKWLSRQCTCRALGLTVCGRSFISYVLDLFFDSCHYSKRARAEIMIDIDTGCWLPMKMDVPKC